VSQIPQDSKKEDLRENKVKTNQKMLKVVSPSASTILSFQDKGNRQVK
jgi:hypothetical protein